MKLPIETDYALRIMQTLCAENKRCDAGELSEKCGITKQTALKVLRKLLCSGLVVAFSGVGGGYELAKGPSEISLFEIVKSSGEDVCFSRCVNEGYDCSRMHDEKNRCFFHRLFCEINSDISERLSGITLAETTDNR